MKEELNRLVSVVTIFYNAEQFIEESIESVLNQTYTNWELLLIDDGSNDRSTSIAKSFMFKYPDKIKYFEHSDHQNKGMSASRNLGIEKSKGQLLCFLDADDIWVPDKLREQTLIMNRNPEVMMLYGNTLFWWSWSDKNKKDIVRRLGVKPNTVYYPPSLVSLFLIVAAAVPATCSIMCRRALFEKINFENSFTGLYEDQAFYYKVCLSEKVYVSDIIWDKYRQHENSACYQAEKDGKIYSLRIHFLLWLWSYMKSNTSLDSSITLAICQELWKNRFLNRKKEIKIAATMRWAIKWLFRFEMILPDALRLYFWRRSKTYDFLSHTHTHLQEANNTRSVILDKT